MVKDIIYFLQNFQCPPGIDKNKFISLKLKAVKYCIITNDQIFWKDPRGILLKCVDEKEVEQLIIEFHKGDCGGHHFWKSTTYKILRVGYYWPSLFSDVFTKEHVLNANYLSKKNLKSLPLQPVVITGPFQQWGLDFIGEINPNSSGQHRWILTATNYFTKWIESILTRNANENVIVEILEENILARFGCPKKIITDNAPDFKSKKMINFCQKYHINLEHSTTYYP